MMRWTRMRPMMTSRRLEMGKGSEARGMLCEGLWNEGRRQLLSHSWASSALQWVGYSTLLRPSSPPCPCLRWWSAIFHEAQAITELASPGWTL